MPSVANLGIPNETTLTQTVRIEYDHGRSITKERLDVKKRDLLVILLSMVAVAAGAVLVNHFVFEHKAAAKRTAPTEPALARALQSCQADGATIETAISAFNATNPGLVPTESELTSSQLGGPYLQSWANDPRYYSFTLSNGVLYLSAGTSPELGAFASTQYKFVGPSTCLRIGL